MARWWGLVGGFTAAIAGAGGCTGGEQGDGNVLGTEDDAKAAAVAIVGGEASEAEQTTEDGFDLWEVAVVMPNSATLEVLLFAEDGALFEVEDVAGPFDYDTLDPLPGQLTYAEARTIALGEVDGEQVAWEVKYDAGDYFYEFYVREVGDQLWEIKLWSDDGEVFDVEAKEEVD